MAHREYDESDAARHRHRTFSHTYDDNKYNRSLYTNWTRVYAEGTADFS